VADADARAPAARQPKRAVRLDVVVKWVAVLLAVVGIAVAIASLWEADRTPDASPSIIVTPSRSPDDVPGSASPTHGAVTPSATAAPPVVLGRVEIVVVPAPAAAGPAESDGASAWLTSLGTLLVGIAALLALLRRPPSAPAPPPVPSAPAPAAPPSPQPGVRPPAP
jgi:hypothetical protein